MLNIYLEEWFEMCRRCNNQFIKFDREDIKKLDRIRFKSNMKGEFEK